MRFSLRAVSPFAARSTRRTQLTALVVACATALVAVLATVGISTTAEAQAPLPVAEVAVPAAVRPAQNPNLLSEFNASINRGLAAVAQAREAKVEALRTRVVSLAKAQIGDTYVAGAAGPNRFDCSGLTRYVFQKAVGKSLPHQSHAQYAQVKKIRFADAKPGDLVFFFRNGAHHVGVYIGNKKMVDAVGYGEGVRISPITGSWWSRSYTGMGRILPA